MKLHVCNNKELLSGYENLDYFPINEETPKFTGHIKELTKIYEPSSFKEIFMNYSLSKIHDSDLVFSLKELSNLLRHDGILIIEDYSIEDIVNSLLIEELDIRQTNSILFGKENNPNRSVHSLFYVKKILEEVGLMIVEERLAGYSFYIKAKRP